LHFLYRNDIDHFLDHLKLRGFHHHFSKLALSNRILFSTTEFNLHSRIFTQIIITATNNRNVIGSDCSIKVFMCVSVRVSLWMSECVTTTNFYSFCLRAQFSDSRNRRLMSMFKRSIRSTCHRDKYSFVTLMCTRWIASKTNIVKNTEKTRRELRGGALLLFGNTQKNSIFCHHIYILWAVSHLPLSRARLLTAFCLFFPPRQHSNIIHNTHFLPAAHQIQQTQFKQVNDTMRCVAIEWAHRSLARVCFVLQCKYLVERWYTCSVKTANSVVFFSNALIIFGQLKS